jgi:predicted Zn-dependent protease
MLLAVASLVFAMTAWGCQTNPATGRRQFSPLPESQEIAIGAEAEPQFLAEYGGEIPDAQIVQYVRNIGYELAALSERPGLPWEFHVVDSAVINAFALPGGKVFISRALLARMTNEAQLAGVLGHEVGHVTAEHIGEQMGQQLMIQGVLAGLGAAVSNAQWGQVLGIGAEAGGTVYLLRYGRDQESEADQLGLRYMTELGYSPLGQVQVMKILKKAGEGSSRPPEWLSTHPEPGTRIERLQEIIPKRYPNFRDPDAYRFGEEAFEQNVLSRLAQLPPAAHRPK